MTSPSADPPRVDAPEVASGRDSFLARARGAARRFLLVTIVAIGALCGVLAVLFHNFVELARTLLIDRALAAPPGWRPVLVVLTPAAMFALLAWCIRRFAPGAAGANLARVRMAYNSDPELVGPRSIAATFIATPLSLGAGAPLGPEGPIVVITSGAAAGVARLLRLPRRLVRGMIPVGVAAGIAAIFNTPITGVVFALEEVFGSAERGLLGGVIVGAVSAAVVERSLLGGQPLLAGPMASWSDARELIGFAVIGAVAGLASGFSISVTHRLKRLWAARMPSPVARAATAGAAIGLIGLAVPEILGVGYGSVSGWLHGGGTAKFTAAAFGAKIVAFIIALSAGVFGGTFAPSLFMGAALGAAAGHFAARWAPGMHIDPSSYALVGMGSFFAGLLRSPIAAVLIVVELTRDYDLMIPLMLAVSLSVTISRRLSRYSMVEQQMIDEGYIEAYEAGDPLAHVRVRDAMAAAPAVVNHEMTVLDAARAIAGTPHRQYPVVDSEERLVGLLARESIDQAARDGALERPVTELMQAPAIVALAGEPIIDVVRRMRLAATDRSVVVDGNTTRRVVGFLTPADILRIRMRNVAAAEDETPFEIL